MQELRKVILKTYELRIRSYLDSLAELLAKYLELDNRGDREDFPLVKELQRLSTLSNDDKSQERYERAIVLADHILASHSETEFLDTLGDPDKSHQIRHQLRFLARVLVCLDTITMASDALSHFEDVRIVPLEVPVAQCQSGSFQDWSANQAISSLARRHFDDKAVKYIMSPQWTKTRLKVEYKKLKTPSSQVHAESQLILAAMRHIRTDGRVFGYIDCSKRSCLCEKFIKPYGGLATRGYHDKIYDLWTISEVSDIPEN